MSSVGDVAGRVVEWAAAGVAVVGVAAASVGLGGAAPAAAKGPQAVVVTGPGIEVPIEVNDPELVGELMRESGLWVAPGVSVSVPVTKAEASKGTKAKATKGTKADATKGDLGPRYELTWTYGLDAGFITAAGTVNDPAIGQLIRQDVYPDAPGGAVINTPSQPGLDGWGTEVIGWFEASPDLLDTMARAGVPLADTPRPDQATAGGSGFPTVAVILLLVALIGGLGARRLVRAGSVDATR